jgi:chloramphenicol-sensitive protein RarD
VSRGAVLGSAAYLLWGLFPLYWPLLKPSSAIEILAQRVMWSAVAVSLVMTFRRGWSVFRRLRWQTWAQVLAAAVLIAVNWGVYIWAVNNGHVVDAALGYFINPLFSVALGVVVLRERLRPTQWVAIAVAALGVLVLAWESGAVPYIGLTLAVSFGLYGFVKKVIPLDAVESLTGESLILLPAAALVALTLVRSGDSTFGSSGTMHAVLLAATGVLTVLPLLAFARAAQLLPLTTMGLLQYITPTLQFLVGVTWAGEDMPLGRWLGFAIVWAALAGYTADLLRHSRRDRSVGAVSG